MLGHVLPPPIARSHVPSLLIPCHRACQKNVLLFLTSRPPPSAHNPLMTKRERSTPVRDGVASGRRLGLHKTKAEFEVRAAARHVLRATRFSQERPVSDSAKDAAVRSHPLNITTLA